MTLLQTPVKLLLINPPQTYPRKLADEFQSYLPMGLVCLASVARRHGADCRIFDSLAYYNVERGSNNDVRWGASDQEIRSVLLESKPNIVGITNPFSMFIEDSRYLARLLKSIDPDVQIVMGGIEASVLTNAENLLAQENAIDICVVGEGEETLGQLLEVYDVGDKQFHELDRVNGIVYRRTDGKVLRTAPRPFIDSLGTLPMPAYDLLDVERMYNNPRYAIQRFRKAGGRCAPVHTSRGCPYKCSFCSVHSQVGYKYRMIPVLDVVEHIEYLKSHLNVTHIHFEDDNLTLSPQRTIDLLTALCDMDITWDTPNGIRADSITPEIAQLMAKSGAVSVTIAVESGDQRVLNEIINKRLDLNDVRHAASCLQDAGILTFAFFIIGFPGETETEVRRTLHYAKDLSREFGTINNLFVATPLIGTPLEKQCVTENLLVAPMNNETLMSAIRLSEQPLIQTKDFSKRDLLAWTQSEMADEDINCVWSTIPVFWSRKGNADRMAQKVFEFYRVRGRQEHRELDRILATLDEMQESSNVSLAS